jgi:hypothetical protein
MHIAAAAAAAAAPDAAGTLQACVMSLSSAPAQAPPAPLTPLRQPGLCAGEGAWGGAGKLDGTGSEVGTWDGPWPYMC